jgi:hypothetical protein
MKNLQQKEQSNYAQSGSKEPQGKARRRRETNLKTGAQNPSPSPSISCTSPFTSP